MKTALPMALGLIALTIGAVLIFAGPTVHTVYCDGSAPRWMLEATNYEGGGCAEVLPTDAAPANADWTPYCLGLCGCKPGGDNYRGVACEAVPFVVETPEPLAYDLDSVKARLAAKCATPSTVFDLVCEAVKIDRITGEGRSLRVSTTLGGRRYDDAVAICELLALAHFDQGRDLGYVDITVLKRDGRARFLGSAPVTCAVHGL